MSSSDGPSSFKDMSFPPPRDGARVAIYAPLPPTPPLKTISQREKDRQAYQEMKKFANKQKCIVCGSQLDGSVRYDLAKLYCVTQGVAEYAVHFQFGIDHAVWSKTTHYGNHFAFEVITNHIIDSTVKNTVFKIDLSLNKRYQQLEKKELFSFEGKPLIIKAGMSETQLLEKMKLYTLFS